MALNTLRMLRPLQRVSLKHSLSVGNAPLIYLQLYTCSGTTILVSIKTLEKCALFLRSALPLNQTRNDSSDCGMKEILSEIIPEKQKEVKEFRSNSGNMVVGDVTVDMVSNGNSASISLTQITQEGVWH